MPCATGTCCCRIPSWCSNASTASQAGEFFDGNTAYLCGPPITGIHGYSYPNNNHIYLPNGYQFLPGSCQDVFQNWSPLLTLTSGNPAGGPGTILTYERPWTADGKTATLTVEIIAAYNRCNIASSQWHDFTIRDLHYTSTSPPADFRMTYDGYYIKPPGTSPRHWYRFYPADCIPAYSGDCRYLNFWHGIPTPRLIRLEDLPSWGATITASGFASPPTCPGTYDQSITFDYSDLFSYSVIDGWVVEAFYNILGPTGGSVGWSAVTQGGTGQTRATVSQGFNNAGATLSANALNSDPQSSGFWTYEGSAFDPINITYTNVKPSSFYPSCKGTITVVEN